MLKKKIIDLRVIRGEDLACNDQKTGKSEPYVVIKLGEKLLFRSKKKKHTLNPFWNVDCTFVFTSFHESPLLRLLVFSRDDFLGEARLPTKMIHTLSPNKNHPLTLGNPNNYKLKKGVKVTGTIWINVSISLMHQEGIFSTMGYPLDNFNVRLKPGDIVLMDHQRFDGVLISASTASRWNHIGIIVPGLEDDLYLLEATLDGVTVAPLEESLLEWKEYVPSLAFGFRRLQLSLPEQRSQVDETLYFFTLDHTNKPYTKNILNMAKGILKMNFQKEDYQSFFCSELVAACWKAIGALPEQIHSSHYLPKHFSKDMPLNQNFNLSSIIEYKNWIDPEKKLTTDIPQNTPEKTPLSSPKKDKPQSDTPKDKSHNRNGRAYSHVEKSSSNTPNKEKQGIKYEEPYVGKEKPSSPLSTPKKDKIQKRKSVDPYSSKAEKTPTSCTPKKDKIQKKKFEDPYSLKTPSSTPKKYNKQKRKSQEPYSKEILSPIQITPKKDKTQNRKSVDPYSDKPLSPTLLIPSPVIKPTTTKIPPSKNFQKRKSLEPHKAELTLSLIRTSSLPDVHKKKSGKVKSPPRPISPSPNPPVSILRKRQIPVYDPSPLDWEEDKRKDRNSTKTKFEESISNEFKV